jgi:hypothetical protein
MVDAHGQHRQPLDQIQAAASAFERDILVV